MFKMDFAVLTSLLLTVSGLQLQYLKRCSIKLYLALGALQVAGDTGMFGPVQHGADLLTQF